MSPEEKYYREQAAKWKEAFSGHIFDVREPQWLMLAELRGIREALERAYPPLTTSRMP